MKVPAQDAQNHLVLNQNKNITWGAQNISKVVGQHAMEQTSLSRLTKSVDRSDYYPRKNQVTFYQEGPQEANA